MMTIRTAMLGLSLALLGACQAESTPKRSDGSIETGRPVAPDFVPAAQEPPSPARPSPDGPADGPRTGENDGYPDLTPAPLTGDAAKSETGARAILLPWARGIELREFDQSWAMMGDAAKKLFPKAQFNAMFHPLRDLTVAIPGGTIEGAAGSSYYTVPTTVTGRRADGSSAVLAGEVVMRRVNDVPGATPAQLRWHIEQVNLKPA